MTKSRPITNVSEAIEALGGPRKIATYLGIDETPIQWLWPKRGFPARYSWALSEAFEDAGVEIDEDILGQRWPVASWKEVAAGRVQYQSKAKLESKTKSKSKGKRNGK